MRKLLSGGVAILLLQACATQPEPPKAAALQPAPTVAEVKPKPWPAGLPADALYDPNAKNGTIFYVPTTDTATLKQADHPRDLSKWLTRSHLDTRGVQPPVKKKLEGPLNGNPEEGKKIAMNTGAGNCWACHALPGDAQPGNQGPSLIDFARRGLSDEEVYQTIYDRRSVNPMTAMPPFGALGTLTDQQVRDIAAYLQSLK
ncbi:MAG: sulfur oxidation c-type cytochrome SoxX [Thiobacillus sp.]